ncbi:MAG TPA: hypothetical protein VK152_09020, partial [Paludibacter sp.]|nr:hypothetical protein [Paludibacter sp.]
MLLLKKLILLLILFLPIVRVDIKAQSQLTNQPTFYINTENKVAITSTEVYVNAKLTIVSS